MFCADDNMNEENCARAIHHHGLRLNQMDNLERLDKPSKPCTARKVDETELGELPLTTTVTDTAVQGIPCHNGACKSTANGSLGKVRPEHRLESPWHSLKTLFLVSIIVALIIWIIVYVLLSQYDVL